MSDLKLEHRALGKGHVTVAYVHHPSEGMIDFAVALCSPMDHFSRRKGRMVAEGRLTAYRHGRDVLAERGLAGTILATDPEPNKRDVVDTVINLLLAEADQTSTRWLAEESFVP